MDPRTVGIYLSRILSGFYLFIYSGKKYKLIYPDITIKYEAELYAQQECEYNRFNDWITDDSIIDTLVTMGLWTYNGDDNLKNLEKQIEDTKVDLYKNFLNPAKIKSLRKTLSNINAAYNRQFSIRHSLDQCTAYGYSQLIKNQYLLIHSLYDENNSLVFKSQNDVDYDLLTRLSDFIGGDSIDIKTYRIIARSDQWRNYWSANKDYLFDKATINWTDEQKTLVVLTKMYDSAYEHPECPPDNVIEDDDLFDGWMIHQRRESEKNKNKNRTEKMLEGKKLDKAGEVFIMANSQEEAQNIYNLNDNTSRHIIRERNTVIQSNPDMIDNTKLPDVQRTLVQQSNEIFKNRK
jgi:hypothetical protein